MRTVWPIERLRDEQPHHDTEFCEAIRELIRQGKRFTILVASDGLILDGHHRARASKLEGLKLITVQIASASLARQFSDIVVEREPQDREAAAARWASGEF